MKQLHNLVNIIPVIAKSDTLTATELKSLKMKVCSGVDNDKVNQSNDLCRS